MKKLKLEIIDDNSNVIKTYGINYDETNGKRMRLIINDNVYHFDTNGDFAMLTEEEFDKEPVHRCLDEKWATEFKARHNDVHQPVVDNTTTPPTKKPVYYNPETKQVDTLFNEENLVPSWCVGYSNPNKGNEGEAVYVRLSASDEQEAKTQALACQEFTKHILPEHFDARYLMAVRTVGTFKLGEVEYNEGDPNICL